MGGGTAGNFGNTRGAIQTQELSSPKGSSISNALDIISGALAAASAIPVIDTFADLAAIPVDLVRGDYVGAALDAFGAIPLIGEVADTIRIAKTADKVVDVVKTAKKVDKVVDATKAVKKAKKSSKVGKNILKSTNKSSALKNIDNLPKNIQKSAKSFFKRSSNNYNNYSIFKNKNKTYTMQMENPGKVPGSKAVYNKVVDNNGNTIKVFKDTFDPSGNLIHRKDK